MGQGGGHSVCEAVPVLVKDCAGSAVGVREGVTVSVRPCKVCAMSPMTGQGGDTVSVSLFLQGLCQVSSGGQGAITVSGNVLLD